MAISDSMSNCNDILVQLNSKKFYEMLDNLGIEYSNYTEKMWPLHGIDKYTDEQLYAIPNWFQQMLGYAKLKELIIQIYSADNIFDLTERRGYASCLQYLHDDSKYKHSIQDFNDDIASLEHYLCLNVEKDNHICIVKVLEVLANYYKDNNSIDIKKIALQELGKPPTQVA